MKCCTMSFATVYLCLQPFASISSEIINKCQCVSSAGCCTGPNWWLFLWLCSFFLHTTFFPHNFLQRHIFVSSVHVTWLLRGSHLVVISPKLLSSLPVQLHPEEHCWLAVHKEQHANYFFSHLGYSLCLGLMLLGHIVCHFLVLQLLKSFRKFRWTTFFFFFYVKVAWTFRKHCVVRGTLQLVEKL